MQFKKEDLNFIRGTVRFDEPMSRHTTFKIGGPADAWISPADEEDLLRILQYAEEKDIDTFIIGGGSKLLVSDNGFRGIIMSLEAPAFSAAAFEGETVAAGCGIKTHELIKKAAEKGLGGLEFLAGIPGTLGGALVMNAGWPTRAIGDLVLQVSAIKRFKEVKLNRDKIKFSYRSSNLDSLILISAKLKMKAKPKVKVEAEVKKNLEKKRQTQDLSYPSVGCIFKNPSENVSAGRLIETSGFKGRAIGDAAVSGKHANFIINRGNAKAADVKRLIDEIQKKVFKDNEIMLKLEVKLIGEF